LTREYRLKVHFVAIEQEDETGQTKKTQVLLCPHRACSCKFSIAIVKGMEILFILKDIFTIKVLIDSCN
jgi:hypothetical protein